MGTDNKAGAPIGTIAIIIIVLVASLGMWWFFTQERDPDCSDVVHSEHQNMESWRVIRTTHPYISSTISSNWEYRLFYKLDNGNEAYTEFYADIDDLHDIIDNLHIGQVQENRAYHIIDCIKADCPDCMVG